MNKKMSKRRRDIKSKLMAAICMLLVSSIMMVSTTYAWFTLSTAPEVTGIQTAVGANGNLEMALLPTSGLTDEIQAAVGDSYANTNDYKVSNITWGNLVDLSEGYGLDEITLFPAELNVTDAGKLPTDAALLKTPTYGADGRVNQLLANTVEGYYEDGSFAPNTLKGVRAVGTASGMTDRQLSYRNARAAASTAMSLAVNEASASLNNNGSALANIAIEHGMGGDSESYGATDVAALRAMINDLNDALDQIETSYKQYILAYAASAQGGTDEQWAGIKLLVEASGTTLDTLITTIGEDNVPDAVKTGITKYKAAVAAVADADAELENLETTLAGNDAATFTWAQLSLAMTPLADPTAMEINGFKASEVKDKLGELVSSVTAQGGLKVIIATGGGVFADIADQAGDYTASVNIDKVEYQGIVLNNMNARMETKSAVNPSYLSLVGTAVGTAGAPSNEGGEELPISDMYGYIIDLAFRTNAAESNLLLQVDAADRIYDNNTNEQTMGHGSSMTFMATTTDFSNDQVKGLMNSIVMVFFNPADGTIYCYGGLDTEHATIGADGITAEIYLYKMEKGETTYTTATYDPDSDETYYTKDEQVSYTAITDEQAKAVTDGNLYVEDTANAGQYIVATYAENSGKNYFSKSTKDVYTKSDDPANAGEQLYTATEGSTSKKVIDGENPKIMALTQNQAHTLSVLVYLDGTTVTNAQVAATGSTSMTGKMNLQFASSATLVPMEYADLHIPGAGTGTDNNATTYTVTINGDESTAATAGLDYTIAVPAGHTLTKVEVGGTDITASVTGNVIPAASVTGNIVITTTAT